MGNADWVLRRNYCRNPSFETVTYYWNAYSASSVVTRDNVAGFDGSWTQRVTRATTTGNPATMLDQVTVSPGHSWCFSTHFKAYAATPDGACWCRLEWKDAAGATIATANGVTATTAPGLWTRASISASAPPGSVGVRAIALGGSCNAGEGFYIDGFLLENDGQLGPYFDGNTPNAKWSGTAGESESILAEPAIAISNNTRHRRP